MKKSDTSQQETLKQARQKGERFFSRKNYPLAKKAFETVVRIQSDPALSEKIQQCDQEIAQAEHKDAIRRGHKLEKKGKFKEAIQYFEKALAQRTETWLQNKIADLQQKQACAETAMLMAKVENKDDADAELEICEKMLAINPSVELIDKKANCLVRLKRFSEAVDCYQQYPVSNDRARYYYGYACVKTGAYLQALVQWNSINDQCKELSEQIEILLPFLCRELENESQGYAIAYEILKPIVDINSSQRLRDYISYFKYRTIEVLWQQEAYTQILGILTSQPDALTPFLLDLYAKVYLKCVEQDCQYIEPAISYGLTAIYNDDLLNRLSILQQMGDALSIQSIRETLLQHLGNWVKHFDIAGQLSEKTRAFWDLEAQTIQQLSKLSKLKQCSLQIFPCTPSFASKHALSQSISEFLREQESLSMQQNDDFFETAAYFSEMGGCLVLMELGEADKAMAEISNFSQNNALQKDVFNYCRQRVFLGFGLAKVKQGEKQLKRYFAEAQPLIEQHPRYADDIIKLAYHDDLTFHGGLADAMELLSHSIKTVKFCEATAHVMGLHAINLLDQNINLASISKLLNRALTIHPDSEMVKHTLSEVDFRKVGDEMDKAFKRQKPVKAAKVVKRSGDSRHIELYFTILENWYQSAQNWQVENRLTILREFYQGCHLLDSRHPLTIQIRQDIKALE